MDSPDIAIESPDNLDSHNTPTQSIQDQISKLSRIIEDQDYINRVLKAEKIKLENYPRDGGQQLSNVKEISRNNNGCIQQDKCLDTFTKLNATMLESKTLKQDLSSKDVQKTETINECKQKRNIAEYGKSDVKEQMISDQTEKVQNIADYQERIDTILLENSALTKDLARRNIEETQKVIECMKRLDLTLLENKKLGQDMAEIQKMMDATEHEHAAVKKEMASKVTEQTQKFNKCQEKLDAIMHENSKLAQEIVNKDKEHAQWISKYQEELHTARLENDKLQKKTSTQKIMYDKEIQNYITILEAANNDVSQLKMSVKTLEVTCQGLQEKLIQKETVQVLLYHAAQCTLINKISSNLKTKLTAQMQELAVNIQIKACDEPQNRSPRLPLIVLCIQSSRLGTDVTSALQNITYERTIVLIIVHNKPVHALPSQRSERILTGSEYKQLGLIVDIAYFSENGLYSCDMNANSLARLCDFIKLFQ